MTAEIEYTNLSGISGPLIFVDGVKGVGYGDIVEIRDASGDLRIGQTLEVDVEQFEAAATRAKGSQDPALFQAALALYPGNLLPEDPNALKIKTILNGQTMQDSNTRQLIFEGRRSGEGYFSPDGRMLVFQSEREPGNPFYQIYSLDLETGDTVRVSPGIGKTTCAFFRPGSDEVIFASTHLDPEAVKKQKAELDFRASGKERRYSWDYDEQMDIFIARRDGSSLRQLTKAQGYDAEASFSPDGKLIVLTSEFVAAMEQLPQLTPLGTVWSYNNAGFYLAGRVIEVVTGKPFESAMQELIFDPDLIVPDASPARTILM